MVDGKGSSILFLHSPTKRPLLFSIFFFRNMGLILRDAMLYLLAVTILRTVHDRNIRAAKCAVTPI